MVAGKVQGVTSVVTATELLTNLLASGRQYLANRYLAALTRFPNLALIDTDLRAATLAARLRARYGLTSLDALEIANALTAGATAFVTNDRRLTRVQDLQVILLEAVDEVTQPDAG